MPLAVFPISQREIQIEYQGVILQIDCRGKDLMITPLNKEYQKTDQKADVYTYKNKMEIQGVNEIVFKGGMN